MRCQARRRVALVQVDQHLAVERREVLHVEALLRPLGDRLHAPGAAPARGRRRPSRVATRGNWLTVVSRYMSPRSRPSLAIRGHRTAQLVDLAAVEQRPGGEHLRGVELPDGAGASLAEDRGGLVADGDARSEPRREEVGGAVAQPRHADGVRVAQPLGQGSRDRSMSCSVRRKAVRPMQADMHDLPAHRQRHADRLAGGRRHQQAARLEARAADPVRPRSCPAPRPARCPAARARPAGSRRRGVRGTSGRGAAGSAG